MWEYIAIDVWRLVAIGYIKSFFVFPWFLMITSISKYQFRYARVPNLFIIVPANNLAYVLVPHGTSPSAGAVLTFSYINDSFLMYVIFNDSVATLTASWRHSEWCKNSSEILGFNIPFHVQTSNDKSASYIHENICGHVMLTNLDLRVALNDKTASGSYDYVNTRFTSCWYIFIHYHLDLVQYQFQRFNWNRVGDAHKRQ